MVQLACLRKFGLQTLDLGGEAASSGENASWPDAMTAEANSLASPHLDMT
ncbi:hypothetical protein [Paraburkholderia piptadeniae]|nr:hypothetical protein [Paraburkholderia piptadeniae]